MGFPPNLLIAELARHLHCVGRRNTRKLYHAGFPRPVKLPLYAQRQRESPRALYPATSSKSDSIARSALCSLRVWPKRWTQLPTPSIRTTIDLCLSLFPWAQVPSSAKARIKLHTLLEIHSRHPMFLSPLQAGTVHDVNPFDAEYPEAPGSFIVDDLGYPLDFERLNRLHLALAFFVHSRKNI